MRAAQRHSGVGGAPAPIRPALFARRFAARLWRCDGGATAPGGLEGGFLECGHPEEPLGFPETGQRTADKPRVLCAQPTRGQFRWPYGHKLSGEPSIYPRQLEAPRHPPAGDGPPRGGSRSSRGGRDFLQGLVQSDGGLRRECQRRLCRPHAQERVRDRINPGSVSRRRLRAEMEACAALAPVGQQLSVDCGECSPGELHQQRSGSAGRLWKRRGFADQRPPSQTSHPHELHQGHLRPHEANRPSFVAGRHADLGPCSRGLQFEAAVGIAVH